jgi:hypothetical protein
VTDLMIALSNPDRFQIDRTTGQIGDRPNESNGDLVDRDRDRRRPRGGYGPYGGYGDCGRYGYDPYGYYDCGYNYYSRYGFGSPYGWWYGGSPVVVVERGKTSSGKAVKGRGYARNRNGESGDEGGTASPRVSPSSGSASRSGNGDIRSGASSTSGAASSGSSSGSSSGGAVRHAKPKSGSSN